jgi:hypothetical protein
VRLAWLALAVLDADLDQRARWWLLLLTPETGEG